MLVAPVQQKQQPGDDDRAERRRDQDGGDGVRLEAERGIETIGQQPLRDLPMSSTAVKTQEMWAHSRKQMYVHGNEL